MLVIMIGRNRIRQAWKIASKAGHRFAPLAFKREVDHHDGGLLDDADQHDDADEGVQTEVDVEDEERDQCAECRRRQSDRIVSG